MYIKFIFFILLLVSVNSVNSQELNKYDAISKFINSLSVVNVEFKQTKRIKNIKREFTSTGKIKFIKNKGIAFKEISPSNFLFIATKNCYKIKSPKSEKTDTLAKLPYFLNIKNAIDKLLNNDFNELNKVFEVKYKEQNNLSWILYLKPKTSKIKQYISEIKIEGNTKEIHTIDIHYQNDTVVNFKFTKTKGFLDEEIIC